MDKVMDIVSITASLLLIAFMGALAIELLLYILDGA